MAKATKRGKEEGSASSEGAPGAEEGGESVAPIAVEASDVATEEAPPERVQPELEAAQDQEVAYALPLAKFLQCYNNVMKDAWDMPAGRRELSRWWDSVPKSKRKEMVVAARKYTEKMRQVSEAIEQEYLMISANDA